MSDKTSSGNDDSWDKLLEKFTEIQDNWADVERRRSVAERKRKGHEIELVESVRLFRQGSGYLLRLQNIADGLEEELEKNVLDEYDVIRVIQYANDYNRILKDVERNARFKSAVESFERINSNYSRSSGQLSFDVDVEGYQSSKQGPTEDDYPEIRKIVLPQIKRLVEDVRDSLIGRMVSGK